MKVKPEALQWARMVMQQKDAATAHEIIAAEELLRVGATSISIENPHPHSITIQVNGESITIGGGCGSIIQPKNWL